VLVFLLLWVGSSQAVNAQSLEPRAYSNAPTGLNFLLAGYQYSSGALLFDSSLPITDAEADVDLALAGYVRTLNVADKLAKIGFLLPYADLSAEGLVNDEPRSRETRGAGDPSFYFSYNFYGAPAVSLKEFRSLKPSTISGFTFRLTAPLGEYDSDKVLNIGTNRWSLESGIGVSQPIDNWTVEASAAVTLFTDNDDFDNGKTRQQDPIYSTQLHLTYSFPKNIWAAFSATYYTGGRTTIDGVNNDDTLGNWRSGLTLALPVNRYHSVKLYGSKGISQRTGTNFDALGLIWQYRWGAGL